MGNGVTTEFAFNFPYFENSNIIVTKNGATATGYSIVGTSAGADADIPYTGGKVVFEVAPTALDSITIARSLPLTRIVDYQPLAKLDPTTLNQDANYLMEVIKDLQDELETLQTQYSEIADKESTTTLLAQIAAIHEEIVTVAAQITALGDISTLRSSVTTNTENIGTLDTRTANLLDYVVESQLPTADNNYTWYRKYKSGWVEQGGRITTTNTWGVATATLPIEMADTNYTIFITDIRPDTTAFTDQTNTTNRHTTRSSVANITTTSFQHQTHDTISWLVSGIAASE